MEIDFDELTPDFPYELGFDMKYIETIGKGAFGTVIHVFDFSSKKDIAVKVINKNMTKYSNINKIKEEISILRILNHPHIVKFYGYMETNNQLLIKMEYIKYGTLKEWIKRKEKISEEEASTIIGKILSAIEYLHRKRICHKDIKPENIMLSRENDLSSIKIIDFGLSKRNFDKFINYDYSGTYIYMAPELIKKKLYFNSIDIWSIGILMFILLNKGKHPFYVKGDNRDKIAKKIGEAKLNFYEKISPVAKHLLLKLLEPNPSWRYTASQAIKHPWITKNINDTPPVTFNESLLRTNKKILKDLFNTSLFMNFLSKKEEFKYITNKKYIEKYDYFNDDNKIKFIKRKEKSMDVYDIYNEVEENKSRRPKNCEEKLLYKRMETNKEKSHSLFFFFFGKFMKINNKPKYILDKRENKKAETNGKNLLINILKRYQSCKINKNKIKFENKILFFNPSGLKMNKNIIYILKNKKVKKSNSMENLVTFTSIKNNDKINGKNNGESKIKQKLGQPQKNNGSLSRKKSRNYFNKFKNLKRNNSSAKSKNIPLNYSENNNWIPLILPCLRKIGKRKENKNYNQNF